nr:hypothetical protein [uncultured Allomuricauda sp.]
MKFKNIDELVEKVNRSDEIRAKIKEDPAAFMNSITIMKDKSVFLKVLYIVSTVLGISLIAIVIWAFMRGSENIPQVFITFGFTALGAVVGLLVPNK